MGTAADAANKATTVSYSSNIEPSDLNVFTSFRSCNASTTDRSVEKWNESWPVCPSIALKNQAQKKAANCGLPHYHEQGLSPCKYQLLWSA